MVGGIDIILFNIELHIGSVRIVANVNAVILRFAQNTLVGINRGVANELIFGEVRNRVLPCKWLRIYYFLVIQYGVCRKYFFIHNRTSWRVQIGRASCRQGGWEDV